MLGCLNASIISASWHVCNQNSLPEISICHYPFLTKIKAKESAGLLDFVAASPSVGGFRWQLNLHCPFSEVFRTPENERCAHSTRAQEPHGGEAAIEVRDELLPRLIRTKLFYVQTPYCRAESPAFLNSASCSAMTTAAACSVSRSGSREARAKMGLSGVPRGPREDGPVGGAPRGSSEDAPVGCSAEPAG